MTPILWAFIAYIASAAMFYTLLLRGAPTLADESEETE